MFKSIDRQMRVFHGFMMMPAMSLAALLLFSPVATGDDSGTSQPEKESEPAYEETVIVSATLVETPIEELAVSADVITREEIERREARTVAELLDDVPGISLTRNGSAGGVTGVSIRGTKTEHTLVLIDGVVANDPITPARSFDFAHLTTENVERIEIVRGPQSTVAGSDAVGGIINIVTRRGVEGFTGNAFLEAGSYGTLNGGVQAAGGAGIADWSFGLTRLTTDGVSAASEKDGNIEEDGYKNLAASGRVGFNARENLEFNVIARYLDASGDLDNFGGAYGDDPNFIFDSTQLLLRGEMKLALLDGGWMQTLALNHNSTERDYLNPVDADHPDDSLRSDYSGTISGIDWQHDLVFGDNHLVTAGIDLNREKGDSRFRSDSAYGPYEEVFAEREVDTWAVYLQDQIHLGDILFATLGVRHDDHELFGGDTNFRIAPAVFVADGQVKLKAAYGTAFKAPSLFQLYSSYGSEDLQPEQSTSIEGGVEWFPTDTIQLGLTYFRNDFDELIDFDVNTFQYVNLGKALTRGFEVSGVFEPVEDLDLRFHFTSLDTEDKSTGEELLRRPEFTLGLDAFWRPVSRLGVGLTVLRVGERKDFDFLLADQVTLDAYTLVDATVSFAILEYLEAFASGRNLLDEAYETVLGYGELGAALYGGLRFKM